jgi:ParB/RepB/Spo0J family partition protein
MEATQPVPPPHSAGAEQPREPRYLVLALSSLRESPTNPRKTFTDLDELATSIREKGVLQPIGVRKLPGDPLRFEIIFGHRRARAAKMAGLTAIPCLVHDLDDRQTAEVQVIENVQRADVHPLEEADGYAALLKTHGYTIERLAAKIGRPPAYVRSRAQLASLCDKARAAYLEGKLTTGVAQLVARLADPAAQAKAIERVFDGYRGECVSVRYAAQLVQDEFLLQLKHAPFDRKSRTLLPIAGACTECPKRTGAQPELFADMKTEDSCTDPACFAKKRDAHTQQSLDAAKASGKKILSASETKKIFPYPHSTHVSHVAPFVDAADAAYDVDSTGKKTWAQVLKGRTVATVLAVDPVGNVRELVPREELKPILKELGKRDSGSTSLRDDERKKREKQKIWLSTARLAIGGIVSAVEADAGWRTEAAALVHLAVGAIIDAADFNTASEVVKRRELVGEPKKKGAQPSRDATEILHAFAEKAAIEERVGLGLELLITQGAVPHAWASKPEYGRHLRAAGKLFGVDVHALEKELVTAQREAKKAKPAAKKAAKAKGAKR